ncbi:Sporulation protein RMD6 [Candida viswanathii]|uniref:Sporulation protein RMD6 n=1 Tax=Candida viswanathii TaxID=5486 RepID=A0A367XPY7_9ASCO|nr:Sporulation protein RMD6 [Candida viswanathii]
MSSSSPFEVIALPYSWIHAHGPSSRFENLLNLINTSYNKPRYKFGIIKTPRIKNNESILLDLAIGVSDEICIYLLLGEPEIFDELFDVDGYRRDLTTESTTVHQAFANDIPEKYYPVFDLDKIDTTSVKFASDDFEFTDDVLNRCVASVGLRSFHGPNKPRVKEFELTAFTSFMRNTAPVFLDFVIAQCLLDPARFVRLSQMGELQDYDKITIHADVIKEHGLVEYYVKKCAFVQADRPDVHVTVAEDMKAAEGIFEKGVLAARDFRISFLEREIDVEKV